MLNKKKTVGAILVAMLFLVSITGFFYHQADANSEGYQGEFEKLFLIYDLIESGFVEEVDSEELVQGAIEGMIDALDDPYSGYLTEDELEDMQSDMEGEYGGLGIIITEREGQLTIKSPFDDTPGDRAGLQPNDMIMKIDGEKTEDMAMENAVDRMRGEPGTSVELTIKRVDEQDESKSEEFAVEMEREMIELEHVTHELLDNDIGYIEFSRFGEEVGYELSDSLSELREQGARGFIVDVRNNPGGLLNEASRVVSSFIESGPAVYVQERSGAMEPMNVDPRIETFDEPLVIISNRGSASGSEILIGAIQDSDRGTIVGDRTFGKGSVQNVIPLSDGSGTRLTVAQFYTPDERIIDPENGLQPDIEVELDIETEADEQLDKAIEVMLDKLN